MLDVKCGNMLKLGRNERKGKACDDDGRIRGQMGAQTIATERRIRNNSAKRAVLKRADGAG